MTARAYWLRRGVTCASNAFIPMEGSHIVDDGVSLFAIRFVTTDIRFALQPIKGARIAVGGGAAWRKGRDIPYALLAAGVSVVSSPSFRLLVDGEFNLLRFSEERRRNTYHKFALVSSEPLGVARHWTSAFSIGIHFEVPLP